MYEQDYTGATNVKERWIPNTGEYLLLPGLTYRVTNAAGTILDARKINPADREIFISGAKDRGYDASKSADAGNVYNNAGDSFEVAMIKNKKIVTLGVLSPDNAGNYAFNADSSELYASGANKYSSDAKAFRANRLWLDEMGKVRGTFGGEAGYTLAIRPRSATEARPGDDLLLTIGIRRRGALSADEITRAKRYLATCEEGSYVAVYDKKMLWRANLYIAETNGQDWNDMHPWNAPLAENDWNHGQGGDKEGKGGQIPLLRFTSPRIQGANDNVIRVNSVAYDYPENKSYNEPNETMLSTDTPFSFNEKITSMRDDLGGYFDSQGNHPKVIGNWTSFYTPLGKWSKYQNVGSSQNRVPSVGLFYFDRDESDANLDPDLKRGNTIGSQMMTSTSFDPMHIGTDCVGFAKNSIRYPGSSYQWANSTIFRNYPGQFSNSIIDYLTPLIDQKEKIKKILPGDIFYYSNHHVGIVFSNDGSGTLNGIRLIEAYFDISIAYVNNDRTLQKLQDLQKPWVVVRLK